MKSDTVVVLCPMDCECDLLISKLEEKREIVTGGYAFFEGKIGSRFTVIARCLMGNVNAAVCAMLAIEKYSPRCIILFGTSGAHSPEHKKNDIIIAKNIVSLAHAVSQKRGAGEGSNPFEWENFGIETYFKKEDKTELVNGFSCDEELVKIAAQIPNNYGNVIVGTVGACDMWNKEADLISHYRKIKKTDCEAMEGVGVMQICSAFDLPMTEIRVISNNELVSGEEFSPDTAQNGQKFVYEFLKVLNG